MTACTDGRRVTPENLGRLERNQIALRTERITRLEGSEQALRRIIIEAGPPLECDALFFHTAQIQHSQLPAMLGCERKENVHVRTHDRQHTCLPGLFLAGDAEGDVQFIIVAAAEGARAAVSINREIQDEDRGESRSRPRLARKEATRRE